MCGYFVSFFAAPSIWGIGLAIVFGAIWLTCYTPPLLKQLWLWAVLPASAILTLIAISFVQIPLQDWSQQLLNHVSSQGTVLWQLLLTGLPALLLSGLVQEGAKLVPVVVWWWRRGKNIDLRLGIAIGAMAGLGFGVFEAQWVHNGIFASGWSWETVQASGAMVLAGFWESFWFVAFHAAASALAGYGLARGWGWQFYLLASCLHAAVLYSHLLLEAELLSDWQAEIFISFWAGLLTGVVHWLGEREPASIAEA